jgi:hypothetical protein
VSFFNNGPDEPPMCAHEMTQVPAVGETVLLGEKSGRFTKYKVTNVEWVPLGESVNVDVRPVDFQ